MPPAHLIAWLAFAVLAPLNWWAVAGPGRERVERLVKPAVLVALIAVAWTGGAAQSIPGRWLLGALAFGLLGDICLLGNSTPRFLAGLGSFLVGHGAYVVAFLALGLHGSRGWWVAAVVAVGGALFAGRAIVPTVWRTHGPSLAAPVAAYSVVIGLMLLTGVLTAHPLIALGAATFVVSDTVLALDRFLAPRPWAHLVVMVTYHLGQALIVTGLLAALRAV